MGGMVLNSKDRLFIIFSILLIILIPYFTKKSIVFADSLDEEKFLTCDEIYNKIFDDNNSIKNNKNIISKNNLKNGNDFSYLKITRGIDLTLLYKPKIILYIEMNNKTNTINRVLDVSLDTNYNRIKKDFSGDIFYNVENDKTIYYYINGDFYNAEKNNKVANSTKTKKGSNIYYRTYGKNHYKYIELDNFIYINSK